MNAVSAFINLMFTTVIAVAHVLIAAPALAVICVIAYWIAKME